MNRFAPALFVILVLACGATTPTDAAAMSAETIFAKDSPSVVRVVVRDGNFKEICLGSGFFVSPDGFVVTNHHVVKEAKFATVLLSTGQTYFVDGIAAWDEKLDIAIIKVTGKDLPTLPLMPADQKTPVGAKVYAIGNPDGLTNTISDGIVSGVRLMDGAAYTQTTAPISPGSSGGPLLDEQGRVVGITTFIVVGETRTNQNLNFAVPAETIRAVLAKANGAKLLPLASAGGKPLDRNNSAGLGAAWAAISQQQWGAAAQILEKLKVAMPDNPQVWYAYGVLYEETSNYGLAIDALKAAVLLNPQSIDFLDHLAQCYIEIRRYDDAAACYKKMVALEPDDGGRFIVTYVFLVERPGEMVEACAAVIKVLPRCEIAWRTMGGAYSDLKSYDKAVESLLKANELKPNDSFNQCLLGETYLQAGKYREAIRELQEAIRSDAKAEPGEKQASRCYYSLALAQIAFKDRTGASHSYQALRRLDPAKAKELLTKTGPL